MRLTTSAAALASRMMRSTALLRALEIRRIRREPALAGMRVRHDGRQRLVDSCAMDAESSARLSRLAGARASPGRGAAPARAARRRSLMEAIYHCTIAPSRIAQRRRARLDLQEDRGH